MRQQEVASVIIIIADCHFLCGIGDYIFTFHFNIQDTSILLNHRSGVLQCVDVLCCAVNILTALVGYSNGYFMVGFIYSHCRIGKLALASCNDFLLCRHLACNSIIINAILQCNCLTSCLQRCQCWVVNKIHIIDIQLRIPFQIASCPIIRSRKYHVHLCWDNSRCLIIQW